MRSTHLLPMVSPRFLALLLLAPLAPGGDGGDWPTWGGGEGRRMVAADSALPIDIAPGEVGGPGAEVDHATARNLKWVVRLGSQSYGNPTVAGGRVYVGTNNDAPRDPRLTGDRSCVYCFAEESGDLLWQLCVPKLGTGMVSDWEYVGICSSPTVVGDRVFLVTNRCEVICLDAAGMADGNDGPFREEAAYVAGPGAEPVAVTEATADVLWVFDMGRECGVEPHNITSSSVLAVDGRLWVTTSNGIDVDHDAVPRPTAPSLIVLDAAEGRLLAVEAAGISGRMFHASWSSPAYLRRAEGDLCIFGGPDGFCYAFAAALEGSTTGPAPLREVWRVDCNPPGLRRRDGVPVPYTDLRGPSEVLATPVVAEGRVYCAIGQEPDSCEGPGNLLCIDGRGEVQWAYDGIRRTMSTPAVGDGLVIAPDHAGFVHCLDARTGEVLWVHDTLGGIWGSPLLAGGRIYLGNEDGLLTILPAGRTLDARGIVEVDFAAPLTSSPIVARGTLYVATPEHLFAFATAGE